MNECVKVFVSLLRPICIGSEAAPLSDDTDTALNPQIGFDNITHTLSQVFVLSLCFYRFA